MTQRNLGTDFAIATSAATVDRVLGLVGGVVKEIPLSKLPVSDANQAAFDPSVTRDRSTHTGTDPASAIVFASGQTLESWKAAVESILAGVSPSAPVNTVAPTAPTGSLSVGSTLTAAQGTWTGASTYAYQWRRESIAISGATATTYVLVAADAGSVITCTVTATATNGLSNSVTSAAVGPVTATLPTNTVAPAVTPSGSQVVGTVLTTTTGTWNNATSATFSYQWFLNSAPIANAIASTFITTTTGTVFVQVSATTAQGTSASAAQSNSITVTGTPTVVNTSAPAWNGTLFFGVQNAFTVGVWTGGIDSVRTWSFFRNSETTPYITPPNTLAFHTPRAPAVVGDTLYIEETVVETLTGTAYKSRSSGAVIQAVATLNSLVYPAYANVTPQASADFNPGDTLTFGGTVRLQRVSDPGGSGRLVYLHRILKSDAGLSGGNSTVTVRSERTFIYPYPASHANDSYMWPGLEYWWCFAIRTKSGEYPTTNDGVDNRINRHLVWQLHTQGDGATQPPLCLIHDRGNNTRFWRRSWNIHPESRWTVSNPGIPLNSQPDGGPWPDCNDPVDVRDTVIGQYPTADTWYKYIVHYRSGFTVAHAPKTEVWEAVANDTYTQVVSAIATSDFNDYNADIHLGTYNRIGLYKWQGTHWETATSAVAIYATEIYSIKETGATSYFNECVATLTGL